MAEAQTLEVRPPIVDAAGLQSAEARDYVARTNQEVEEIFDEIITDPELSDDEAILKLTRLELWAERAAAHVLRLELAHALALLQEIYNTRGRVIQVQRDANGQIVRLVGINGNSA
jgi:hypothetical protein